MGCLHSLQIIIANRLEKSKKAFRASKFWGLPFVHLRFISVGFREKGTGTIIRVTGWRLQVAGYEMQVAGYGLRVRGGEVLLCCG